MKQLLLYFLFFVVSSLIFLQCAKMFPSPTTTHRHKAPVIKSNTKASFNGSKKTSMNLSANSASKKNTGFSSKFILPVFSTSPMYYLSFLRMNRPGIVYNPYVIFKSYNLSQNKKWQSN